MGYKGLEALSSKYGYDYIQGYYIVRWNFRICMRYSCLMRGLTCDETIFVSSRWLLMKKSNQEALKKKLKHYVVITVAAFFVLLCCMGSIIGIAYQAERQSHVAYAMH